MDTFDVGVVGAGVVGAAAARELTRAGWRVVLLEAKVDVGAGTSKANTAILHTGFDAAPGSVESRLVARGYRLLREYAPTAGISVETTGALLVAWDDEQAASLPALAEKAAANDYPLVEVVDGDTVRGLEPHVGPGVTGGMLVPDEHIIDPWSTPIAFATDAVANGCTLLTDFRVAGVEIGADTTLLTADDGRMIRFLDLSSRLLAADGTLSREIMPDLLHPDEKGYQIRAEAMEGPLAAMLN